MKSKRVLSLIFMLFLALASCGPVVITSRPNHPPPPWFYPNRLEVVRYVYFPEYSIYYDLTMSNYLYMNNGVWVRVKVLPPQYRNINLNRSRYVRVKGYRGDNIRDYHNESNIKRGRSNIGTGTRGRSN
ncbi:MAG: hypothetical protein WBA61_14830 [Aequorivita sp.]